MSGAAKDEIPLLCVGIEVLNASGANAALDLPSIYLHLRQDFRNPRQIGHQRAAWNRKRLKKYPKLDRFGDMAGKPNENFLNADLFTKAFLGPCEAIRPNVGLLMFEFSRFWPSDYEHGRDFVADLDQFLGHLPKGWPYAVEMRNRNWLPPDYFECLTRHQVAHVLNSWEAMPPVGEQMAMPGCQTNPALVAARFLLKPGRRYEEAAKTFQPYDKTKEVSVEARKAGAALIADGVKAKGRKTFIYVNNRLEGNALSTIDAMVEMAG